MKKQKKAQVYKVDLYTKKITQNKSTILDNLSVQFHGDFGNSAEIKPNKQNEKNDSDMLNEIIHCHCKCSDLGNIFKLQLRQLIGNNKKLKTRWYLEKVKVSYLKESYTFPYQKWIVNYDTHSKKMKKFEIKLYEEVNKKIRNYLVVTYIKLF